MWHKPCRTFNPWCLCIKTRCLWTDWEPMSRFTFKWDRSWVRTTITIMVAYVLTWDIHQVTNSFCRIQIHRVFSKHNTYMCRYIARMYNRSRLVDARPSAIDMLTKRWIYRLNDVSNRVKHVVQVIKKMFEISWTRHRGSIVRRFLCY